MRKKIILWTIILLIFSFIFSLLFYKNFNKIQISATGLSQAYSTDKIQANQKYLDKNIIVTGTVKAFYKLLGTREVLEMNTGNFNLPVFCFFRDKKEEFKASQLEQGQKISVKGKCVGVDAYTFVKGVKIEVNEIN